MAPYLVHTLGDSMYGVWVLVLSITGYMGLLDSGIKTSIVRYIARHNATSDTEGLNGIATTSLVLYCILSLVVVLITTTLALGFERMFKVSPDEVPVVRAVVCLGGAGVALSLPVGVFGGLVVGLQRYDLLNKANIILLAVRTAGIVALLSYGLGVVAVSAMQLVSQVLLAALLVWYAYRVYPSLAIRWSLCRKETVKLLYGYSGFMLLNNLAMFALFYSGEVVVGIFLGMSSVTYYAIAASLVQYLSKFVGAMTQVLHPYASDQEARGNTEQIRKVILMGTKLCLLVVLPVALTYILLGKTFIGLWMGPSYVEVAGPVLVVSAIGRIIWLAHSGTGNVLLGIGKHKVITSVNIATGVASIALSTLLVREFGVLGVAIGTTVSLIVSQIFMALYIMKVFNISIGEYWGDAYVGPFLASVPFAGGLVLIEAVFQPTHLLTFFAEVFVALILFVVPAYFTCFTRSERQDYFHRYLRWTTVTVRGA
jgi:O-antigen/teichoic acid export membrane protein